MGNITTAIASAFRDFVTDGVASSGVHEPVKSEVRALGPLIEAAIGNAGLGALVSVTKTTKALLDADLAHDADTVALVYADATDANNDLYVKTGASGAGSWTLTGVLHGAIDALAQGYVDAAAAAAEAVLADSTNLLDPDAAGWMTDFRNNPPNGIPVALASWDTTPFIPVQAGTYVTNLEGYAVLYDENEVFQANLNVSAYWASPVLTVPSAGLVRLSAQRSGNYARSRMFFQPGSDWPAVVEPFGKIFNDETLFNADGAGLADQSVGPEKLQTWELGANRAKPNGRVDGYYMATNGSPVSSTTYSYWPAIAVEPGQVWTANQSMRFVTFYDAAGRARSTVGITTSVTQFTVPAGCYYAVPTSTASTVGTFAIALGATVPTWTPYGWRGRDSLPDGTPLLWGQPEGSELVSTLDAELGGTAWRAAGAVPDSFGLARLRETRQRLRSLRSGVAGANAQINIGFMGDSFSHDSGRYVLKVAHALWGKYHAGHANMLYGPIGPGWIGFNGVGSGSFPNGTIYWNNIASGGGSWTTANGTGNGPDSGRETSSSAGASIQFDWTRYSEGHTFRLFAEGGAGVVRYRWTDAGAWTNIDLSALAAGVQIVTLAGAPASGSGTIRFEVVSGTVSLYGVDVRLPTTAGVIVH